MNYYAPETVKVQREACDENPTGIVVINKEDLVEGDVVVEDEVAAPATEASVASTDAATDTPAADTGAEGDKKPWQK